MIKDQSDSERGNPLPPHGLLLPISRRDSTYHGICFCGIHIRTYYTTPYYSLVLLWYSHTYLLHHTLLLTGFVVVFTSVPTTPHRTTHWFCCGIHIRTYYTTPYYSLVLLWYSHTYLLHHTVLLTGFVVVFTYVPTTPHRTTHWCCCGIHIRTYYTTPYYSLVLLWYSHTYLLHHTLLLTGFVVVFTSVPTTPHRTTHWFCCGIHIRTYYTTPYYSLVLLWYSHTYLLHHTVLLTGFVVVFTYVPTTPHRTTHWFCCGTHIRTYYTTPYYSLVLLWYSHPYLLHHTVLLTGFVVVFTYVPTTPHRTTHWFCCGIHIRTYYTTPYYSLVLLWYSHTYLLHHTLLLTGFVVVLTYVPTTPHLTTHWFCCGIHIRTYYTTPYYSLVLLWYSHTYLLHHTVLLTGFVVVFTYVPTTPHLTTHWFCCGIHIRTYYTTPYYSLVLLWYSHTYLLHHTVLLTGFVVVFTSVPTTPHLTTHWFCCGTHIHTYYTTPYYSLVLLWYSHTYLLHHTLLLTGFVVVFTYVPTTPHRTTHWFCCGIHIRTYYTTPYYSLVLLWYSHTYLLHHTVLLTGFVVVFTYVPTTPHLTTHWFCCGIHIRTYYTTPYYSLVLLWYSHTYLLHHTLLLTGFVVVFTYVPTTPHRTTHWFCCGIHIRTYYTTPYYSLVLLWYSHTYLLHHTVLLTGFVVVFTYVPTTPHRTTHWFCCGIHIRTYYTTPYYSLVLLWYSHTYLLHHTVLLTGFVVVFTYVPTTPHRTTHWFCCGIHIRTYYTTPYYSLVLLWYSHTYLLHHTLLLTGFVVVLTYVPTTPHLTTHWFCCVLTYVPTTPHLTTHWFCCGIHIRTYYTTPYYSLVLLWYSHPYLLHHTVLLTGFVVVLTSEYFL